MTSTTWSASIPGLLAFTLASCGGNTSAPEASSADHSATTRPTESPATIGTSGTGFIQIGDLRHELTVRRCMTMAGALGGQATGTDQTDNIRVNFDFSPQDWKRRPASEGWDETGSVTLRSEEPYLQWSSGPSAVDGFNLQGIDPTSLDITALEISADGRSARGKARFLDVQRLMRGEANVVDGSFEFVCPPK